MDAAEQSVLFYSGQRYLEVFLQVLAGCGKLDPVSHVDDRPLLPEADSEWNAAEQFPNRTVDTLAILGGSPGPGEKRLDFPLGFLVAETGDV